MPNFALLRATWSSSISCNMPIIEAGADGGFDISTDDYSFLSYQRFDGSKSSSVVCKEGSNEPEVIKSLLHQKGNMTPYVLEISLQIGASSLVSVVIREGVICVVSTKEWSLEIPILYSISTEICCRGWIHENLLTIRIPIAWLHYGLNETRLALLWASIYKKSTKDHTKLTNNLGTIKFLIP